MRSGNARQQSLDDFVEEFLAAGVGDSLTYEPREDTFLMLDILAEVDLRRLRVLDIGTGSGILAAYCAKNGAEVIASDIDMTAIQALNVLTQNLRISLCTVQSDVFSRIEGEFDIILFNPPYLPSEKTDDRTTDGGCNGTEVIRRFLDVLPQHLTSGGCAILIVSSLNDPERLCLDYPILGFEELGQCQLFFEKLYATKVTVKQTF